MHDLYAPVKPAGRGLAVTSLVLALVAIPGAFVPVLNVFSALLGVLALVFALVAMKKMSRGTPGRGMATAGLVLSFVVAAVFTVSNVGALVLMENSPQVAESPTPSDEELDKMVEDTLDAVETYASVEDEQAVLSAEGYLAMGGFSRDGLIEQLSSEYGEGFPRKIATKAVDSLDVDWNEQAVIAGEAYVSMGGFSRDGLIEQLSSEYGEGFTVEQATHAADVLGY